MYTRLPRQAWLCVGRCASSCLKLHRVSHMVIGRLLHGAGVAGRVYELVSSQPRCHASSNAYENTSGELIWGDVLQ